jgi:hypothetical protein
MNNARQKRAFTMTQIKCRSSTRAFDFALIQLLAHQAYGYRRATRLPGGQLGAVLVR